MKKIYEGDEWKYCEDPKPTKRRLTRAEEQARIDLLYAENKMDQAEWLRLTDELSEVSKWTAEGRIEA